MPTRRNPSLLLPLMGHLAMGAALGAFLAVSLVATHAHGIFHMIVDSAAPRLTMGVFVGIFAAIFAVGATLTGYIFIEMEDG